MTEMGPAVTFTRGNIEDTKGSTGQLLPNMKYDTGLNEKKKLTAISLSE
jgi:hypothetical protein